MRTVRRTVILPFSLLGVLLLTSQALAAAPTPASPMSYWAESPGGSWALNPNSSQLFSPEMVVSPTALGHNNGDQAVHVFTVDSNGNLWDSFSPDPLGSPATWTRTDVTALTGATVSTSVAVGALYLGGSNPSTQVFALSPAGQLLSFTTPGDGGNWQVFDLSSFSGSTAVLTTAPHPIQFGSTVDVYATDNQKHLQDFYKPLTSQWQDVDLTNQTGDHAIFGVPYAYGGNSIQTVSTSASGDLETFVQGVFPNGLINPSVTPAAFDITHLAGGEWFPLGPSSPVVAGGSTVNIFVNAENNFGGGFHLFDFTKTPTGQWTANIIATPDAASDPSAIWNASVGLHVVTSNGSALTDLSTSAPNPPFNSSTLPSAGTPQGDPSLVGVAAGSSGPTLLTFSNHS